MELSSATAILKSGVLLALLCLCSSDNENWLQDSVFTQLPEECIPRTCSDDQTNQNRLVQFCDCEESCSRYHTCCIDSPYAFPVPAKRFWNREQCTTVQGSSFDVFMVSRCNPRWRRNQITRTLCETTTENVRDPIAMVPVTNTFSKITYKNYFCSLCNFDNRGVVLWNLILGLDFPMAMPVTEKERENILRRLEYDINSNGWGIRNRTENNDEIFIPISVSAQIPPTIASSVKSCDVTDEKRLVSVCASTWNDSVVERICRSYFSPITVQLPEGDGGVSSVHFRNPHCAVCNYMGSFEKSYCIQFSVSFEPGLSFTLLLDVNPSDGDRVGETSSCSKDEVYDPFFKKCRALVCALPGYVIRNRQCVNA